MFEYERRRTELRPTCYWNKSHIAWHFSLCGLLFNSWARQLRL